nr:BadF/BadG/BcrA/BcrD ATPase family protein [Candidatus Hydrogenedentota bacterium]
MTHFLAFDGGGTATRAGLYDLQGRLLAEAVGGASNPVALGEERCLEVLTQVGNEALAHANGGLEAVGAALSGTWSSGMGFWLADRLRERFEAARVIVCDDIRPILFANIGDSPGILATAGTGSSVVAQRSDGRSDCVGGRGALFGDDGSAFQIGQSAMRAAARAQDGLGPDTILVALLPEAAGVESFRMLPLWAGRASMRDVAGLAKAVAQAADSDMVARSIITDQAHRMAELVRAGAVKAGLPPDTPVLLNGGVFEQCPLYLDAFRAHLMASGMRGEAFLAPVRGHR